ncbi:uncharacterized protein CMC5_028640 [Chondromyces crocatus]|uniref:Transposase n=2 Tax=Chondromyces crocatus TaxID=52 RepID=A0A0K1ECX4_CHOCO|nr:uncharacterized protein CMC5_028640 [Chondromyces crocatus]
MPLVLSDEQRRSVEARIRPAKAEKRIVQRGQALLLMADGVPAPDIAQLLGVHCRTVEKWRRRFSSGDPVAKLTDAPRSGRPRSLSLGAGLHPGSGGGDPTSL